MTVALMAPTFVEKRDVMKAVVMVGMMAFLWVVQMVVVTAEM